MVHLKDEESSICNIVLISAAVIVLEFYRYFLKSFDISCHIDINAWQTCVTFSLVSNRDVIYQYVDKQKSEKNKLSYRKLKI